MHTAGTSHLYASDGTAGTSHRTVQPASRAGFQVCNHLFYAKLCCNPGATPHIPHIPPPDQVEMLMQELAALNRQLSTAIRLATILLEPLPCLCSV